MIIIKKNHNHNHNHNHNNRNHNNHYYHHYYYYYYYYSDKDNDNDNGIDNPLRPGELFNFLATSWELCYNNNYNSNNSILLLRHIHGLMVLYLKICVWTRNEFCLHVKFFIIRHFISLFRILSFKKMQCCLVAFGLLAWDSKKAAQQQFLKHIYWNFIIWNPAFQKLKCGSICQSVPVVNKVKFWRRAV